MTIRSPAVAGLFYPDDPALLEQVVGKYLAQARVRAEATSPKALIVPHAGYAYSGSVAATAFAQIVRRRAAVERVVLLGPCHRVALEGIAASEADFFSTPLGSVPVDTRSVHQGLELRSVRVVEQAHVQEHSLEVELPFLQQLLDSFHLVPIVVGRTPADEVADLLDQLWGGDETLIVVSSDLSHYLDYETAVRVDARTSAAIEQLDCAALTPEDACGFYAVRGLLTLAQRRGLRAQTLDLRNSGDAEGSRNRVVGYGAYAFA